MTEERLAWAVRTAMVVVAAVCTYALAQTDVPVSPEWRFICGAALVVCAALNPATVASKLSGGA